MFSAIKYQTFIENPIVFLSDEQVTEYIAKYLKISQDNPDEHLLWENANDYEECINKTPGLKNLIKTPFLLMVIMDIMPSIIKYSDENKLATITKAQLLDEFVQQLFEREEDKLMIEDKLPTDGSDIKEDFWAFAMELAVTMHECGTDSVGCVFQDYSGGGINIWDRFFGTPIDSQQTERLARARNGCGCVLKITDDGRYSFIHPILQDYFVVKKILLDEEKMIKTTNPNYKQINSPHRLRL
jgi:hypothetical protein